MKRRFLLAVALAIVFMGASLTGYGLLRYGGPANLWRRINTEIAARRPHPAFVPTPLPVAAATVMPSPDMVRPTATLQPRPATATLTVAATSTPATSATAEMAAAAATASTSATPSPSPSATASPTATSSPAPTAPPPAVRLTGLAHAWQTWNNCGPATLAMNLSYFGLKPSQADIASILRPNRDDKNVSPEELAAYARDQGLYALARSNGNIERLRQFIAAGVPVLIETWHEPKPNDGMGHYRLLTGYDDAADHGAGQWIAYDSYDATGLVKGQPYTGIRLPYAGLEALWAVFNRQYVVIYDDARAESVERILGADLDEAAMWQRALEEAKSAVVQKPNDPFAWFNLGTDLRATGDYGAAADAYDRARRIGLPWRMLWYQFGPFKAYYETGRYAEIIVLADATIRTAQHVEELFFWRGLAQQAQGDLAAARESWQRALALNPHYVAARDALAAAQ